MKADQLVLTVILIAAGLVAYDALRHGEDGQPAGRPPPPPVGAPLAGAVGLAGPGAHDGALELAAVRDRASALAGRVEALEARLDHLAASVSASRLSLPPAPPATAGTGLSIEQFEHLLAQARHRDAERKLANAVERRLRRVDPPLSDAVRGAVLRAALDVRERAIRVRAGAGDRSPDAELGQLVTEFEDEVARLVGSNAADSVLAVLVPLAVPGARLDGVTSPPLDSSGN